MADKTPATAKTTDKVEMKFQNVDIVREGSQIILPKGMTLEEGRIWLDRKAVEEERQVAVDEVVEAHPLEGAYAFAKAIAHKYGFAAHVPTPGFFGDRPPMMIGIETGLSETAQVPWGRVEIPGMEKSYLETSFTWKDNRMVFTIGGQVKQKYKEEVMELANLTRQNVRERSVYRGKAVSVKFQSDPEEFNIRDCPKFIDTSDVNESDLIFSAEVDQAIATSIFTPIERTQLCRDYQIPLKRGILLEGPFGVGKTLTARVVAKKCVENGWTYIYLTDVKDLKSAIYFAKSYQPAVIFAEDVNRVMDADDDRTEEIDEILNTIDGVDTKGMELVVILTTNRITDIEPAMMRPGRLDAVINVQPPDAKACVRLIELYARGRLDTSEKFDTVGQKLSGQIPAVIREAVERSKLAAVRRLKKGEKLLLKAADLEFAADEVLRHVALMTPKPEDERTPIEKAADTVARALQHNSEPPKSTNGKSTHPVTNAVS